MQMLSFNNIRFIFKWNKIDQDALVWLEIVILGLFKKICENQVKSEKNILTNKLRLIHVHLRVTLEKNLHAVYNFNNILTTTAEKNKLHWLKSVKSLTSKHCFTIWDNYLLGRSPSSPRGYRTRYFKWKFSWMHGRALWTWQALFFMVFIRASSWLFFHDLHLAVFVFRRHT